jgi:hypothetical protein
MGVNVQLMFIQKSKPLPSAQSQASMKNHHNSLIKNPTPLITHQTLPIKKYEHKIINKENCLNYPKKILL